MPLLRGHHLICLHFFHGEGYNEAFVKNLKEVLRKVEEEEIRITNGVDDICKACPYLKDDRCEYAQGADEEVREMDETALKLLNIKKGAVLKWEEVKRNIPWIFSPWYSNYCYDCDWLKTCEDNPEFQRLKKEVIR